MSAIQQRFGRGMQSNGRQQKFFVNTTNNNRNRFNNSNTRGPTRGMNGRKNFNNAGQGVTVKQPHRDAIIRRNLDHMKLMAQKKRVAQERYYGNGRSPMVKTPSGPFLKQETGNRGSFQGRVSVQQRLGNRGISNNVNSNTKQIFINTRPNTNKVLGGMRSDKFQRVQNIQQKKRVFRNNNPGTIKTINAAGKVVYLQPVVKRQPPRQTPNNYTVRVQNDRKHHLNHGLNPVLQQEIKMIQNKSRQIISPVAPMQQVQTPPSSANCDRLPIVTTSRTLHERFSMM